MIYTVTFIYLAVIVYLEISHRVEMRKQRQKGGEAKPKATRGRHFSPHRKAIDKMRRDEE